MNAFCLWGSLLCCFMDRTALDSDGYQKINVKIRHMSTNGSMKCFGIGAKLAHITQNSDFSCQSVIKCIKSTFHGIRTCIVAVIQQRIV